jgi:hypothetical protein
MRDDDRRTPPERAHKVLPYLPGDDRPDEWVTTAELAAQLGEIHSSPALAQAVPGLLSALRRAGYAVCREGADGVAHWRRTPSGTTAAQNHRESA